MQVPGGGDEAKGTAGGPLRPATGTSIPYCTYLPYAHLRNSIILFFSFIVLFLFAGAAIILSE